jgi:ribonucleoside-diphosphate reductase alpha chain
MGPVPRLPRRPLRRRRQAASKGQRRVHAQRHQLHREAVEEIQPSAEFNYLKDEARRMLGSRPARGKQVGYRNAQVTVLAPTGTIAFLMDCDTTGVEPDIALVKYKVLAGGGMLKIVNRTVPEGLRRLGYNEPTSKPSSRTSRSSTPSRTSEETARPVRSGLKPEHLPVFDCAFKPSAASAASLPRRTSDDGRRPAVHQRRDLQDRQHAQRGHRRGHPQHLRRSLEDGPQVRGHLSRRLQALATAQHQEDQRRRRQNGRRAPKAPPNATRSKPASRNSNPKSIACKSEAGKPLRRRLPETRTALTHKFDIAGHEGYLTVGLFETASPANCSSPWPRKVRPSAV